MDEAKLEAKLKTAANFLEAVAPPEEKERLKMIFKLIFSHGQALATFPRSDYKGAWEELSKELRDMCTEYLIEYARLEKEEAKVPLEVHVNFEEV